MELQPIVLFFCLFLLCCWKEKVAITHRFSISLMHIHTKIHKHTHIMTSAKTRRPDRPMATVTVTAVQQGSLSLRRVEMTSSKPRNLQEAAVSIQLSLHVLTVFHCKGQTCCWCITDFRWPVGCDCDFRCLSHFCIWLLAAVECTSATPRFEKLTDQGFKNAQIKMFISFCGDWMDKKLTVKNSCAQTSSCQCLIPFTWRNRL